MSQDPEPGERRLDRAPSERFVVPDDAPEAATGSVGRAIAYGAVAAVSGAILTVLLGGVVALSAGLLVVWASTGNVIGMVTRLGGGAAAPATSRAFLAVMLALIGVALGQWGLWWYAGTEGGVLPLVDYLATTFGVLVPLQVLLAIGFAWWGAR